MKQITQKELIQLIEDKQENAKNTLEAINRQESWTIEASQNKILAKERNKAYYDAYQDLICYIKGVVIVPDGITFNKIPKAKPEEFGLTQDDLKKLLEKAPITPYTEPKVEPLRNDRFREFEEQDGDITYLDGKSVVSIEIDHEVDGFITIKMETRSFYFSKKEFDYNELVEWWKYWKQNKGDKQCLGERI